MIESQSMQELPEPVKKYFSYALGNNQKRMKEVRLKHTGYFKTSPKSKWVKIKGKQYFLTRQPEFKWIGKTFMFKAVDQFKHGKGSLRVSLFGLFPIVNERGMHVDQAELLRWLGESVWFPTNLLPSKHLKWSAMDSSTAKITYTFHDLEIYYIVSFNQKGEISQLKTKRYIENGRLEAWIGKVSEYKEMDGVKIPTHVEAIWSLDTGDFKYADFYLDSIEYDY